MRNAECGMRKDKHQRSVATLELIDAFPFGVNTMLSRRSTEGGTEAKARWPRVFCFVIYSCRNVLTPRKIGTWLRTGMSALRGGGGVKMVPARVRESARG